MYEHIFRHVMFPLYEKAVKQRGTGGFLREYSHSQWLDRSALEAVQLRKLNALLAHCWANVPFLQEYWHGAGLTPRPLGHAAELARYPVLTKQLVTGNFERMRAPSGGGRIFAKSTSGSTGEPFRFEYTEESYARRTAVMWRGYEWCGAVMGRRTAYLWGVGVPSSRFAKLKDRWYHAAFNRVFLNCNALSEANIDDFITQLDRFRPRVIVGFIGPLTLISRRLLEQGRKIHRPEAIIGAAEALSPSTRDLVSRAFGTSVYNSYGCREFMLVACECAERNGLHVNMDHLVVETVDAAGRPVTDETGDVCVTDLHNFAMPFVRFLNGDRATWSQRVCACGRQLPLLQSIDGRVLDMIVSADGRMVPGEFFVLVMLDFPQVRQFQIIQDTADALEVRIVPGPDVTAAVRSKLVERIAAHMGRAVRVWINEVAEIPLTSGGKRRVTVSNLHRVPIESAAVS